MNDTSKQQASSPSEVPEPLPPPPPPTSAPGSGLEASLQRQLQRAWIAYNRAWSRRGEPNAAGALAAARLDVLLLLAQDSSNLDPALLAQLADDAGEVLNLDTAVYPEDIEVEGVEPAPLGAQLPGDGD